MCWNHFYLEPIPFPKAQRYNKINANSNKPIVFCREFVTFAVSGDDYVKNLSAHTMNSYQRDSFIFETDENIRHCLQ